MVNKLYSATLKAMANSDVLKRLADGGVDIVVSKSPADFVEFVKSETSRFGTVIEQANIVAD